MSPPEVETVRLHSAGGTGGDNRLARGVNSSRSIGSVNSFRNGWTVFKASSTSRWDDDAIVSLGPGGPETDPRSPDRAVAKARKMCSRTSRSVRRGPSSSTFQTANMMLCLPERKAIARIEAQNIRLVGLDVIEGGVVNGHWAK